MILFTFFIEIKDLVNALIINYSLIVFINTPSRHFVINASYLSKERWQETEKVLYWWQRIV